MSIKTPVRVFVSTRIPKDTTKTYNPPYRVFLTYRPAVKVEKNFDVLRRNTGLIEQNADTLRRVHRGRVVCDGYSDMVYGTRRTETTQHDVVRDAVYIERGYADTLRRTRATIITNNDTIRHLPYTTQGLNPSQISISLQRGTLSDTFQITTPYDMAIESTIKGRLLDFDYKFLVYESNGRGLMRTLTGMYDVDKLLYTPFNYRLNRVNGTAKDHAGRIAELLGKRLVIDIDNFTPDSTHEGLGATIQDLIGSFFGWASNLPQRWINVFLRGDKLYIIQRGHEPNTIDITNTHHSSPTVDKHLMRSVWAGTTSGSTYGAHGSINIEPIGFSGTIRFGEASCTYRNGLLVSESGGGSTTRYSYSGDGYLTHKTTTTKDGQTVDISYSYATARTGEKYLAQEIETTSKPQSGTENTASIEWEKRVTQHTYIGNGWYGTSTYIDGVYQGSSVGQGKPGQKASKYVQDQSNLGLGGGYRSGSSGTGAALFDTSFPIKDTETLKQLTKDIEWLNRKTCETITMDIWQYPHLIDFTDRVRYNGHNYYLESNEVTQTPRELKQSVTLVRWY